MNNQPKWDQRFLDLAILVSTWSKDPSTQTGAVIVDPWKRIVSVGFNGFPQRIADDERLDVRAVKYEMIVHAELNALIFAKRDIEGCALYTSPFMSCSRCAAIMIQAEIRRQAAPNNPDPHWVKSCKVGAGRTAELCFPTPPSEPGMRLSPHPALQGLASRLRGHQLSFIEAAHFTSTTRTSPSDLRLFCPLSADRLTKLSTITRQHLGTLERRTAEVVSDAEFLRPLQGQDQLQRINAR